MWLLVALIVVPIIEIALFIEVGDWLGLWPTLALVVATAFAGAALLRWQGMATLGMLRERISQQEDPTEPIVHGAMILFAGGLLLTPGFFTDAVGFALLVPGVRTALFAAIRRRIALRTFGMSGAGPQARPEPEEIIEGEWVEDANGPPNPDSKWSRPPDKGSR